MSDSKSVEIIVYGHVQGVGFRWFIHQKALELGVKGFVRNHYDGNVVINAMGTSTQIEHLINFAKSGPTRSNVSEIKIKELSFCESLREFSIR